ncbi:hypothetical protein GGI21_000387 [Coemansia aciculifera]|uniref:Uncharacterized protein n=1 Tax=Coemansia aciculifera TaxID=417176 RepID=A0ACC1M4K5_9FUNG|nr:hypothetical protein IWW38_001939 [Coemansia aciculifera]KAJ2910898.1 hypothetical protein GGI21_000387 [Coemansia aciculifera]
MDEAKESPPADAAAEEQVTSEVSVPTTMSLKQIYGMLCWLQVGDNSKRWQDEPLEACKQAVCECPHLVDTDAEQLCAQMETVNEQRKEKIAEFGDAESVPQDARVFPSGPLFSIVNYALSGHCASSALIEAHGTGRSPTNEETVDSSAGGPIRNSQQPQQRPGPYSTTSSMKERARRLTPAEIQQMRDELAIRREIAMRDAVLLADWTALKRRELEIKELKLRELIRNNQNHSVEGLLKFEEYINSVLQEGV